MHSDYEQLIEEYREQNRGARNTPEPMYFSEQPTIPNAPIQDFSLPQGPTKAKSDEFLSKLDDLTERLATEFVAAKEEVKSSKDVIRRDPLEVF